MDSLIGYVLIVAIVVAGVGLVLVVGTPVIDNVKAGLEFKNSEDFMLQFDKAVREVAKEGEGSSRILRSSDGSFQVSSQEDSVEFSQRSGVFDYLTRKLSGNLIFIAGSDVSCYESDANNDGKEDLVMENSYIKAALNMVNGSYSTQTNIVMIKNRNFTIFPTDSSIMIDGNPSTSSGEGFSYIQRPGKELPKCRVHYAMNSTLDYDIYYTLYSGADFITVEVRNE